MLPSRQCAAGDAGPVGHLLLREAGVHARGFEGQFRGGTSFLTFCSLKLSVLHYVHELFSCTGPKEICPRATPK